MEISKKRKVVGPYIMDPPGSVKDTKQKATPKKVRKHDYDTEDSVTISKAGTRRMKVDDGGMAAKLEAIRTGKVVLFDLMERADNLSRLKGCSIEFRFSSTIPDTAGLGAPVDRTGVEFTYSELRADRRKDPKRSIVLFPHSEAWEASDLAEAFDVIEKDYHDRMEEEAKKNATLRALSPEQRLVLGFGFWTDPEA